MYQPSQLQAFLNDLGITAKKGLSQNFLIDGNIIRKIVDTAHVQSGDLVVEIGPGPGALTQALLGAGAHVLAVEKDRDLAHALPRLLQAGQQLEVSCDDILTFPLENSLSKRLAGGARAKVIANLPYHLTTPILELLIPMHERIETLTLMVQKEVAHRMVAAPGSRDYSSLTLFLHFFADVKLAFTVSQNCFYPRPSVDSAVVTLTLHAPLPVSDQTAFFVLTRTAFMHRRKMLRSSLKDLYAPDEVMAVLQASGCDPQARPEELSVDQFRDLFEKLQLMKGKSA